MPSALIEIIEILEIIDKIEIKIEDLIIIGIIKMIKTIEIIIDQIIKDLIIDRENQEMIVSINKQIKDNMKLFW